jgi:hypothetical protein
MAVVEYSINVSPRRSLSLLKHKTCGKVRRELTAGKKSGGDKLQYFSTAKTILSPGRCKTPGAYVYFLF